MFLCPVESKGGSVRLTQHFGERPEYYAKYDLHGHNGIDLTGTNAGVSVPVYSPYDAMVVKVGDEGKTGYGRFVRLYTDPEGKGRIRDIVLGHLSGINVKEGQRVYLGDQVGMMGQTGDAVGLHLHVGLRYRNAQTGIIIDLGNGFSGYVDFEQYLLFWKKDKTGMVTYPFTPPSA